MSDTKYEESILRSLRRITRAIDLYSRRLSRDHRLTGPQLVCLRQVVSTGRTTPSELADAVSLSRATVTGIVDRLEAAGLVERHRDDKDRRRIAVVPTEQARTLVKDAPTPLQDLFAERLEKLDVKDQARIAGALDEVVRMMEAEDLDAAPMLTSGDIHKPRDD